ncbi:MAG: hypothetical protein BA873_01400 [Desulfobulbaceae bacterium C00003063]|nr:MAG: hypothetical protein BA873_01400 [Desulfobulbaceae bacterium C00003063]
MDKIILNTDTISSDRTFLMNSAMYLIDKYTWKAIIIYGFPGALYPNSVKTGVVKAAFDNRPSAPFQIVWPSPYL